MSTEFVSLSNAGVHIFNASVTNSSENLQLNENNLREFTNSAFISTSTKNLLRTNSYNAGYLSIIEQAIIEATQPINVIESEEVTVGSHTGRWINKEEIIGWNGVVPINQYEINIDQNPTVIRKKSNQNLFYEQEVAIRYLRPPTPPPPGEILIKQEANIPTPPAPPMIIRQVPPRPATPPPLVVREAPPRPPASVGRKVITISGKRLPPSPRKVVIERLAPLPSKPQAIMIERWLPYAERKRRIIFQKNTVPDPIIQKPKNLIVQWEAPDVHMYTTYKDLGVIHADPNDYVSRYGASLLSYEQFPEIAKSFNIRPPIDSQYAHDYTHASLLDLEGDISALNMINLDEHGLGEYKTWLSRYLERNTSVKVKEPPKMNISIYDMLKAVLAELFETIDTKGNSRIALEEAQNILVKLNQRLGRQCTNQDAKTFISSLGSIKDGYVDFAKFNTGLLAAFTSK